MKGIFGGLFDLNKDGELGLIERAMELAFLEEMINEEEKTELELSGLDPEELEFMDSWERRCALEEAGLDPDEYDF